VLDVPGHTHGHVAYLVGNLLFSGDVLFGLGCGRLFEGSAAIMQHSLAKLAALPVTTQVCCGHEYTRRNLTWALAVEPDNAALVARAARVRALPDGATTVPLDLGEELLTNPMLRWDHAPAGASDRIAAFAALRAHRDAWRG
jgi:hydroxyacylglutathione hydrolase